MKKVIILFVVLVGGFILFKSGALDPYIPINWLSKERIIEISVKQMKSERDRFMKKAKARAVFKDVDVFADSEGSGIVLEYKLARQVDTSEVSIDSKKVKSEFVRLMRGSKAYDSIQAVLRKGVSLHVQYLQPDGELLLAFEISQNDI